MTPGFTGDLANTVSGLVGVTPIADSVTTGAFDIDAPVADADTKHYTVAVPAGTTAARFSLDAATTRPTSTCSSTSDGDFVDLSASGAADEQVTLIDPADGHVRRVRQRLRHARGSTTTTWPTSWSPRPAPATPASRPTRLPSRSVSRPPSPPTGPDSIPAKRWFGVIDYTGTDIFTLFSVG